jgi:hypothetical protein
MSQLGRCVVFTVTVIAAAYLIYRCYDGHPPTVPAPPRKDDALTPVERARQQLGL